MSALDEYARGEQRRIIVDGLGLDALFVRFKDIPGCSIHKGYVDYRIAKHLLISSSVPGDGFYYGYAYAFPDAAMIEVRDWYKSNPSTAVKGVLELLFFSYNLGISGIDLGCMIVGMYDTQIVYTLLLRIRKLG